MRRTFPFLMASLFVVCAATPAVAGITPTTGPKGNPIIVCLANPGRTLTWLAGVKDLANRLGLGTKGFDAASQFLKDRIGADLLAVESWTANGLNPEAPICLMGPTKEDEVILAFGVSSDKKALDLAVKVIGSMGKRFKVKPAPIKVGRAKAWRFAPKGSKPGEGAVFAVIDKTGYIVEEQADLEFIAREDVQDYAKELAFPQADVAVVGWVDFLALGKSVHDKHLKEFGMTAMSSLRAEAAIGGGKFAFKAEGRNSGLLIMAGQALEKNRGDKEGRLKALRRIPADSIGFTQFNVPVAAIMEAVGGIKAGEKPSILPDPLWDLLSSVAGDATLTMDDGLVGVTVMASLTNPARCQKGLDGLVATANSAGVGLTEEKVDIAGNQVRLFRFGKPPAWFRFPVFVAVKDGLLMATISRAHMAQMLGQADGGYLDRVDTTQVKEAIDSGKLLISHGYVSDLLGNLTPYASVAREAIVGDAAAWVGLFDLPAMALDLMYDGHAIGAIGANTTGLTVETRFLKADPMSADSREKAYGMALRARYSGRSGAFRSAMLDMIKADAKDAYGQKARRMLVQPDPMTDYILMMGMGAAAFAMGRTAYEAPIEAVTPCREYMDTACEDPKSKACKDAEKYFEKGVPTEADQQDCQKKLNKLGE